jgi:AAA domain-containing protein
MTTTSEEADIPGRLPDEWPRPTLRRDLGAAWMRSFEERTPLYFPTTSGEALLEPRTVALIYGEEGAGKSYFLISECLRVADGGGRVAFIDYETDEDRFVQRLQELGPGVLRPRRSLDVEAELKLPR